MRTITIVAVMQTENTDETAVEDISVHLEAMQPDYVLQDVVVASDLDVQPTPEQQYPC